jgi:hypothetical protein
MTAEHARLVADARTARSGILILRAQADQCPAPQFRIRITHVAGGREAQLTTTGSVEDACRVVRQWIEALLESPHMAE